MVDRNLGNSPGGFTLLELLLVVTILVILAAILLIAINPAEMARRGRDATRFQDIENVRKAIGLVTAQQEENLPGNGGLFVGSTLDPSQNRDCADVANSWLGMDVCTYLSTLPVDPRHTDGAPWAYEFAADGEYYELRCRVESTRNYGKAENDGGDNNTCPDGDCWYEVGTDISLDLIP